MNLRKKHANRNPYFSGFFTLSIICTLTLCSIFYVFNFLNIKQLQDNYYQEKAKLITQDFERQLEIFEDIALKISISKEYEPEYIKSQKFNEILLLKDFSQYQNHSVLTENFFLYYQEERIFLSSNSSSILKYYTNDLSEEHYRKLYQSLSDSSVERDVLYLGDSLYLIFPLKGIYISVNQAPKLCFVVNNNDLKNRFFTVSGISNMAFSIFYKGELLYASHDNLQDTENFKAYTVDETFTFTFSPLEDGFFSTYTFLPFEILLFIVNLILILVTTYYLAAHTYRPLKELTQNYRQKVAAAPENTQHENALEELNYLLNNLVQDNISLNNNTLRKQKQLHRQILRTLLFNNFAPNELPSLDSLQIELPGPLYYVISISFLSKEDITDEALAHLQERLETLTDKEQREYLYCICNYTQKQLILVCSIAFKEQNRHLTDRVLLILGEDSIHPIIGVGNIHDSLSRISASWLESTETIHKQINSKTENVTTRTENHYKTADFATVINKLTTEDEETALQEFHNFMNSFQTNDVSFLMQQYEFSNIISELSRLANRTKVETSDTSISLLISAKNAQSFQSAGDAWIRDFYQQKRILQEQIEQDENFRIFEYINNHFTDGDLSIEKVASSLSTTTTIVRQAILAHTGMTYRDYVIHLRIEHAKDLLVRENLSINEVCEKVGYFNVSHFTQLFKKHTGTTPASYKKNPSSFL